MRILKSVSWLLLFLLACQNGFANTCDIMKGQTTPFGTTYCVPAASGVVYHWSPTGTLNIVSGQNTACVTVTGSGTLFVSRDVNNTHCYTSIDILPGACDGVAQLSAYISGDLSLAHSHPGMFNANVSGGNGQYIYRWYRSDTGGGMSVVGQSSSYGGSFENTTTSHQVFWIEVEVQDSCGQLYVARHFVTVDNQAGGCGPSCQN